MLVDRVTLWSVGLRWRRRFWISLVLFSLIFKVGSADALAKTVVHVLAAQDRWPAMRQVGRRFVEAKRNWRASVATYASIYASLAVQS